jgi:hypothetical protein
MSVTNSGWKEVWSPRRAPLSLKILLTGSKTSSGSLEICQSWINCWTLRFAHNIWASSFFAVINAFLSALSAAATEACDDDCETDWDRDLERDAPEGAILLTDAVGR